MTRRARYRCAACDRPLKAGRGRPCARDCGARLCRAPHLPHCTDVHASQCPNYCPEEPTVTADTDWVLSAYGAVVAALRDDHDAVAVVFENLDAEQSAMLATATVLSMAVIIRDNFEPDAVADLITAVQACAAQDAAEAA